MIAAEIPDRGPPRSRTGLGKGRRDFAPRATENPAEVGPVAAAALPASELRYRRLFEVARDGILILDAATGRILDADPFMAELLGYDHPDFLGKGLREIGLFDDQDANRAAYEVLLEKGYICYEHLPPSTKAGQEVEVEFISNVYLEGAARVIQCNIRDITGRRRLEERVREQAEALADSNRRKDEFLAILSHELRNPLAAIIAAVDLLHFRKPIDSIQEQAQAIVQRQAARLVLVVEDVLEVTLLSTGLMVLHPERCEAGDIIRRAVDGVAHIVAGQGHELTMSIPPRAILLGANPGRIEQVVANLLVNAVKYTDPAGGSRCRSCLRARRWSFGSGTRASGSRRSWSPGSSSCSRRPTVRWRGRGVAWGSG